MALICEGISVLGYAAQGKTPLLGRLTKRNINTLSQVSGTAIQAIRDPAIAERVSGDDFASSITAKRWMIISCSTCVAAWEHIDPTGDYRLVAKGNP